MRYLIALKDDSAQGRIRAGDCLLVDDGHAITLGDEVVILTINGEAYYRELVSREEGFVVLRGVVDRVDMKLPASDIANIMFVGAIVRSSSTKDMTA